MTISAKLISFLTIGFREEKKNFFFHEYTRRTGHAPWLPHFLMDQICVSYFCKSPGGYFCQIILNSDKWFHSRKVLKFSLITISN